MTALIAWTLVICLSLFVVTLTGICIYTMLTAVLNRGDRKHRKQHDRT